MRCRVPGAPSPSIPKPRAFDPVPCFFFRQIPSNIPCGCTTSRGGEKREPHRASATARVRTREVRRVCLATARAYGNGMIIRWCVDSAVRGWITGIGLGQARAPSAAPGASASASGRRSSRRRRCCSCQSASSSSATPPSGTCSFLLPCHLF